MPRQRSRSTAPEVRDRNTRDILGRPGRAGIQRIGGGRGGGRGRVASAIQQPFPDVETAGAAQLLCLSVTADPIASDGDYVTFDTIVAQHGFEGVIPPSEGYWVHPITGVYVLTYEHAWDTFDGGGTIQLEIDGTLRPECIIADGTSGQVGAGIVVYAATAGSVGRIKVTQAAGAAQVCDAFARIAIPDPSTEVSAAGVSVETIWLDSKNGSVTTSVTLQTGVEYRVVVTGNYRIHASSTITFGSPQPVMFPSPGEGADNAEYDAEVQFAGTASATYPRHAPVSGSSVTFDLGSGESHVEPTGGPFSAVQSGHSYEFVLTGEGSPLTVKLDDAPYDDNNGRLRVEVYYS